MGETSTSPTLEEIITFPMQRALNELQRTEPLAVNLPPRPYDGTRILTPAIQGSQCLAEYHRAKRFKLKKEMILYLYYLGEVIERSAPGRRKEYEPHREYLSYHYWKVAIKAYKLFRVVGPKQIFRTTGTFTVTTVGDMTLDEIDAVENMFGYTYLTQGNWIPMLSRTRIMWSTLKILTNFNRRLKCKKGRVLRQEYTSNDHVTQKKRHTDDVIIM